MKHIGLAQSASRLAGVKAGQGHHRHVLGLRGHHGGDQGGCRAGGTDGQQHVARRAEGPHSRRSPATAIAARPGRSRSKRPIISAAPCCANAEAAPVPQSMTLPPAVIQPSNACAASAIGLARASAVCVEQVGAFEELLLNALFEHGHGSYDTLSRRQFQRCISPRRRRHETTRSSPPSMATTSKRHGGGVLNRSRKCRAASTRLARLAAPTLAAAPPWRGSARARTSTKTSVPSRSRRIRSSSPPRAWGPRATR